MLGHSAQILRGISRGLGVVALVVFLGISVVGAEEGDSPILEKYRQRVWTTNDGLPDNWVHSILQSRNGYLWIGTRSGLARFDGIKFSGFYHPALANRPAHVFLAEDLDGALWVGTPTGLLRFLDGSFTQYTTRDGLWDNYILGFHTDLSGDIWVVTEKGLSRVRQGRLEQSGMDGLATNAPAIPLSFCEDKSGRLWILSKTGIHQKEISSGKLTLVLESDGKEELGTIFADANGAVWLGGRERLAQFEEGRFVDRVRFDDVGDGFVNRFLADRTGTLWFNTGVSGLGRLWNGHFSRFDTRDGLPDDWIFDLCEDREGNLWIGTAGGGLVCWQPRRFTTCTTEDGLPDNDVRTVFESQDNSVWIGTEAGICQYQDGKFTAYKREAGPRNSIRSIAEDSTGALWLGTVGEGVVCLRDGQFTDHPLPGERYGKIVRSLAVGKDDSVWMGTGRGLYRLSQGRLTEVILTNAMPENVEIWGLHFDRAGNLWAGGHGVARISPEALNAAASWGNQSGSENPRDGLGGADSTPSYLFPAAFELSEAPNALARPLLTKNERGAERREGAPDQDGPPLPSPFLPRQEREGEIRKPSSARSSAHEANQEKSGTRWNASLPTQDANDSKPSRVTIPASHLTVFNSTNGLSNNSNWALHEDSDGVIWVGNDGGLNRIKAGRVSVFNKREGLPDQRIEEILEDDLGNFWIAWERGIFRVPKAELNAVAEGRASSVHCVAYDERDTLPDARINGRKSHPAGCKTRDGRLWLPTTNGVVVFDPKKVIEGDAPPPVIVESVRADGKIVFGDLDMDGRPVVAKKEVISDQKSVISSPTLEPKAQGSALSASSADLVSGSQIANRKSEIRLPAANARVMEFDYTACDLVGGDRARYKYRLDGFDSAWIDAGTRRRVFYSNLRPGHYRFHVIACNHNGLWNDAGASFAFYLAPQFYQTKAFFAFSALIIALAGVGLHQVRVRVLRRIHNLEHQKALALERTRIARDIHDDLGARLTQIDLLTGLAQRDLEPEHDAAGHVRKIAARSQEITQSVDEIVWALNPKNDSVRSLLGYVRAYVQEYLGDAGLRAQFDWLDAIPAIHLGAESRHNLFLVVKEALHNVVRHARATEVVVRVTWNGLALRIEVADNGTGFNPASVGESGNGLRNMERRVASLGGYCQIDSQPGGGTRVRLSVPILPSPGRRVGEHSFGESSG